MCAETILHAPLLLSCRMLTLLRVWCQVACARWTWQAQQDPLTPTLRGTS